MDKKEKNEQENQPSCQSRRDFLKLVGVGTAGIALAGLSSGCNDQNARDRLIPTGQMTYRHNPKSGDNLSLLGFGMMRLPIVQRWRGELLPDTNDIDQEAVNDLVDFAISAGVNFFDTAPPYCKGFSERATGEALSRHPRDKYFIATKLSNMRARDRESSINMYHRSFQDLKVDYIDYYFLHNVGNNSAFQTRFIENGVLDFLFREKEAGRIRNLGWSFHGDGEFFEWLAKEYPWDFTMIQLNYLDWGNVLWSANVTAKRLYDILSEQGIPVFIMEPLLGGGLALPHYKARELMTRANAEVSAASWAFRFAGNLPNVATVLSGMTFMDHLKDNIHTYSPLVPLTEKEKDMLTGPVMEIALEYRNILCTRCQYCMPCPYGIDIPEIFTHYNRCLNEGNYPIDKQSPDFKRARRAFLVGMDRRISPLRQADRCINCNICRPACPQRINIPAEMRRISRFVDELRREV
ncbi:MAG: aldo/keto reductase [Candidatus Cloacimonetes bacterium]|nr:aldo/keto reductase [Candidatus Cloacimonadota bacterium]